MDPRRVGPHDRDGLRRYLRDAQRDGVPILWQTAGHTLEGDALLDHLEARVWVLLGHRRAIIRLRCRDLIELIEACVSRAFLVETHPDLPHIDALRALLPRWLDGDRQRGPRARLDEASIAHPRAFQDPTLRTLVVAALRALDAAEETPIGTLAVSANARKTLRVTVEKIPGGRAWQYQWLLARLTRAAR